MNKTLLVMAIGFRLQNTVQSKFESLGPNGELLLEYSIFDAIEAGFNRVVFVVPSSFFKEFRKLMRSKLDQKLQLEFVSIRSKPFSTFIERWYKREKTYPELHAIGTIKRKINKPFLMIKADKYYGKQAYRVASNFLELASQDFGIMSYPLGQTLSNYGRVDRGFCRKQEDSGKLASIIGLKGIKKDHTHHIDFISPKGVVDHLSEEDLVSTSMFCLNPTFFDLVENMLTTINLKEKQSAELLIPDVINCGIKSNKVSGQVLEANSNWFGVTYKADRILARYKIEDKIKLGLYPQQLFNNNN